MRMATTSPTTSPTSLLILHKLPPAALKAGATAIKAASTPEEKRAAYLKQLGERRAAHKEKPTA